MSTPKWEVVTKTQRKSKIPQHVSQKNKKKLDPSSMPRIEPSGMRFCVDISLHLRNCICRRWVPALFKFWFHFVDVSFNKWKLFLEKIIIIRFEFVVTEVLSLLAISFHFNRMSANWVRFFFHMESSESNVQYNRKQKPQLQHRWFIEYVVFVYTLQCHIWSQVFCYSIYITNIKTHASAHMSILIHWYVNTIA